MPRRARAITRDRRLTTFYETILRNAALNFNNKAIQDIQTAVRHMLERDTAPIRNYNINDYLDNKRTLFIL